MEIIWLFKTLNQYIASYKWQFILLFICLICGAAFDSVFLLVIFLGARLGILITNNIRHSLFDRIQRLSMEFFGRRSAGDIVNCPIADVQKREAKILTTIERITKERTVIFITHRMAHALRADVIYVLENGSLVVSD